MLLSYSEDAILLKMVKKENILMLLNFSQWSLFSEKRP